MEKIDLIREIIATYRKHGWALRGVRLRAETQRELLSQLEGVFPGTSIQQSSIDALWFSRPSHGGAEAWELRTIAETPYALFERIGTNESEEKRASILELMEARLQEYLERS